MNQRTDVTDLIPKALGNYWLIFFGGAAAVAVLEYAYRQLPVWAETLGEANLAPLNVTASGSVMAWCLSSLFLLSAGVSLLNSRLGKKYDDPAKGDVWFWAAFALVFLSLDTQVQFRETLRAVLVHATGTPLHLDGAAWWLAVYAFVFGLIAIRLLSDMWAYPPSFLLFSASVFGAVASQLVKIGVIRFSWPPADIVVLHTALEAFAVLFLFLSFLLFGRRQVFRDPQAALQWFAKVWKQEVPTKKPMADVVGARAATLKPETTSESLTETAAQLVKNPSLPNARPELRKSGDDDFSLLHAS